MAEERIRYTNGAAAYDIYQFPIRDNTAQQPQRRQLPQELPQETYVPQRQQRVRAKTAVAPFTMFGMVAVMCMLVLVIFGYVQLYEATSNVSRLENRLASLQQERVQLQGRYDGKLDLRTLEEKAAALGLSAPKEEQIVYVRLSGTDRAEIYETEKTSVVGEIWSALEQSVSELIAYLRPAGA